MTAILRDDLSVEHCLLTGVVYDLFQPLYLHDVDFQSTTSDKRYVLYVHHRLFTLNEQLKSLATMYSMLAFQSFPIITEQGNISRQEWIHITLDTILSRITSIRDCVFLLVNGIFELNLHPRKVSRNSLVKHPSVNEYEHIVSLVNSISVIDSKLRDERDVLFHRGERRALGNNPQVYYVASVMESLGHTEFGTDVDGEKIDLEKEHKSIVQVLKSDFTGTIDELGELIESICIELYPIFKQRFIRNMQENGGIHPSAMSLIERAEHYAGYYERNSNTQE